MPIEFTVFKGSKDGTIKQGTTRKDDLKRDDVLVRVTHSGVCGTDLHYRGSDMALGHEGTGIVEALGPDAHLLKKGDRVGWGYEHDCCGHCRSCLTGWETMCPERKLYGLSDFDQGSFASHGVWREAFLFKIPEKLKSEDASPLMCGGSTVFNALHVAGVKSTARVGIVGVGGLGHLAIQFAAKMGCQVVVFSGTDSKKKEALELGATEFHATKGVKELKLENPIDNLIVTTSSQPDWHKRAPARFPPDRPVPPTSVIRVHVAPQQHHHHPARSPQISTFRFDFSLSAALSPPNIKETTLHFSLSRYFLLSSRVDFHSTTTWLVLHVAHCTELLSTTRTRSALPITRKRHPSIRGCETDHAATRCDLRKPIQPREYLHIPVAAHQ